MDDKLVIQLGETKNINSVNVDNYSKIQLNNKSSNIREYDIRNILSVTEVFNIERQSSEIYRIYGGFQYISILNNMKSDYQYLVDYFDNPVQDPNIAVKGFDQFDVYLVKPADTGYTKVNILDTGDTSSYVRKFEVIATEADFEFYNAGYANNLYGDQEYAFNFTKDFDTSQYFDEFGIPVVELYLYLFYRTTSTSWGTNETMSGTTWSENTGEPSTPVKAYTTFNIGDLIDDGDKLEYLKYNFSEETIDEQTHYIRTPYKDNTTTKYLQWKYDAFIPFRLRYFSDELKRGNTGTTSYNFEINIPAWATDIGEGNRVWRNILDQGYTDPLTGNGVDYPFVNGRRYLFSNIVFSVVPDLDHTNTQAVFNEILYPSPETLDDTPTGEIDNIGKPCL